MKGLTMIERMFLVVGFLFLAVFVGDEVFRKVSSTIALRQFDVAQAAVQEGTLRIDDAIDFRLWSQPRVTAYHASLSSKKDEPVAVIYLAKANIRAPVYGNTGLLALDRGVGWIAGSARPGEDGNIGIAGHRDGFFRRLKDVAVGDAIELSTLHETAIYRVNQIEIVKPADTGVLRPRGAPSLTLVTCYPFYYIGDAPKRYIVHASLEERIAKRREVK